MVAVVMMRAGGSGSTTFVGALGLDKGGWGADERQDVPPHTRELYVPIFGNECHMIRTR
jgi:hypothetical protein